MPQYIVRQVREARIEAESIDLANSVGSYILSGEPRDQLVRPDIWEVLEEPSVKVFVVEED